LGRAGEAVPLASERYVVTVLDRLGYAARLKRFASLSRYVSMAADSRNRAQAGLVFWIADYPAVSDFINSLLSCAAFTPRNPYNANWAEFCDSRINAQIRQAMTATGPGADQLWARIDHQLVDQAPLVPLVDADAETDELGGYPCGIVAAVVGVAAGQARSRGCQLAARPAQPGGTADSDQTLPIRPCHISAEGQSGGAFGAWLSGGAGVLFVEAVD